MNSYRNLNEYLEANHQAKGDVIESVAEAALTLLMFVDEHSPFEVSDIMKLSEPLHTLYGIMSEVNEDISNVKPQEA